MLLIGKSIVKFKSVCDGKNMKSELHKWKDSFETITNKGFET